MAACWVATFCLRNIIHETWFRELLNNSQTACINPLPVPRISESCIEIKIKFLFLFSHFFVVPQKVL